MVKPGRPIQTGSQPGPGDVDWVRRLEEHGRALWRARPAEERLRWRRYGYIGAIVVNALLLALAHNLLRWDLPYITPAWAEVVWVIDLSLGGAIVANALLFSYDESWFRELAQVVMTGLSLVAWLTIVTVFPFDFGEPQANALVRLIGVIVIVALAIAILVQAVVWIVDQLRRLLR